MVPKTNCRKNDLRKKINPLYQLYNNRNKTGELKLKQNIEKWNDLLAIRKI